MSRMRNRSVLLALILVGCASAPTTRDLAPAGMYITVDDQLFADIDVYLVRDGHTVARLGEVIGHSERRFLIRLAVAPNGDVAFDAKTVTGERYRSDIVSVEAGRALRWAIGPSTNMQALTWR